MLIQGFNTFLPAGYRIECTSEAGSHDYITVTTPMGTTTQAIASSFPAERDFVARGYDLGPPHNSEIDIELALSYVQKVKTRYANDPERYKAFLEILSPPEEGGPVALNDVRVSPRFVLICIALSNCADIRRKTSCTELQDCSRTTRTS